MTRTERFKIAKAIFEIAKLPGADKSTAIAIAQQIVSEFAADEKFTPAFVMSATGVYTTVDYRDKLAEVNGHAE